MLAAFAFGVLSTLFVPLQWKAPLLTVYALMAVSLGALEFVTEQSAACHFNP